MKSIIPIALATLSFLQLIASGQNEPSAHHSSWLASYNALLARYVSADGVDYKAWHGSKPDRKKLAEVTAAMSRENLAGKSKEDRLAFYLNAYNANILDQILKSYPTKGPGGGGLLGRNRFFKKKSLTVAGRKTSFHLLENEIIRPTFQEPRIHFALNCASASCPPLDLKAFEGRTLDTRLSALTRAFVENNPSGVRMKNGKEVMISKIFDWYADDFKSAGGPLPYINEYRTRKLPSHLKVSFQPYHWTLNEAPKKN
ncbi:MAG: DUF547 domain-containing protein [Verrucomicrobiota bacterium]